MMKLSREWFVKGYINKDAATTTESAAKKVAAGAAFSYSGQTNVGQGLVESLSTGMDIVMFPVLQPIITTNLVIGSMFAVPRQSKNPERALQFIARLHTDKQLQNIIVYGIEGKHYVKKDAGMIEPAPGIAAGKNPYLNLKWMFGNQSLLFDYGEKDRGAAAALDKFNGMAIRAKDLGFTFNQTSVKTEVGAIANVIAQYDPVIASGSVDATVGLYDEFIAALKAAGVQKVVDEANAQLKAWTAVNKK
jgi:putative aldouronate transport system substrate-binding protein